MGHFVRIERLPWEEVQNFHRRRMRIIARLARQQGTWGKAHAERVVASAAHLQRPRNQFSIAAHLYGWRGPAWLQSRQVDSGVMRPLTRALPGFLSRRWDESINDARAFIEAQCECSQVRT